MFHVGICLHFKSVMHAIATPSTVVTLYNVLLDVAEDVMLWWKTSTRLFFININILYSKGKMWEVLAKVCCLSVILLVFFQGLELF